MATAYLTQRGTLPSTARALADAHALVGEWESLVIQLPDKNAFVDCATLAFLCSWGLLEEQQGRRLLFRGDDGYLARMDLHRHLGLPYEVGDRLTEAGRLLPLRLVAGEDDVFSTVNAVCDLCLFQFDDARAFVPALEWAVNEIVDNIRVHSDSPVPGAVCAQVYPNLRRMDVGIYDMGRGIRASLATNPGFRVFGHGDAVKHALQRGVTRDQSVGQGNGMAGALEIVRVNGGAFEVSTGDVLYRLADGVEKGFQPIPTLPGTGVLFSLSLDRPVDLAETWIAGSGWSFLDAEASRIVARGGLDVAASCAHTGGRPPATALRRKVMGILPGMDEPLVLDFGNVKSASSSFLDELLGRLVLELGEPDFRLKVRIQGMTPTVQGIANVVIAQRLGTGAGS